MSAADDFLKTFARLVVEETLAQLGAGYRPAYTTARSGPFAPGKTRAWMLRNLKTMPNARKVGRDYMISADDFDRWAAEQDVERLRKASGQREASATNEALADRFLKRGGFRATKGAA